MATNEILQFASTNTGTNLLTQAEYSADAQRTTGNQPGIARSKLVNKALRQSSLLAAGLAEFIADYQANNVTDSLTPQNIADYLLAAITANIPVVPDASTTVKGKIQLATATEAQAFADALKAITPSTLNQSFKGANQQTAAASGYQKLPGGLIVQWGQFTINITSANVWMSSAVTFPVAFPNECLFVTGTERFPGGTPTSGPGIDQTVVSQYAKTGYTHWVWDNGQTGLAYMTYVAIGY